MDAVNGVRFRTIQPKGGKRTFALILDDIPVNQVILLAMADILRKSPVYTSVVQKIESNLDLVNLPTPAPKPKRKPRKILRLEDTP